MFDNYMEGFDGRMNMGNIVSEYMRIIVKIGLENLVDFYIINGIIICMEG